jgi:hypothetical protein
LSEQNVIEIPSYPLIKFLLQDHIIHDPIMEEDRIKEEVNDVQSFDTIEGGGLRSRVQETIEDE